MDCFADINVSQGSVATYASCGGIFYIHLTANLPRNLSVKKVLKSVKNWQNYGHESVAPFYFDPPCTVSQKKLPPPLKFSGNIFKQLRIFRYNFTRLLYVHICEIFIQSPLTMTQLRHIKRDHLVNFYVSLKNAKNCDILAIAWPTYASLQRFVAVIITSTFICSMNSV